MRTATDYAEAWAAKYEVRARCEGWSLFHHDVDDQFEIEAIDDDEAVRAARDRWLAEGNKPPASGWPRVTSDSAAVSHVINYIHLDKTEVDPGGRVYYDVMYLVAFYLDRRACNCRCWLPEVVEWSLGMTSELAADVG